MKKIIIILVILIAVPAAFYASRMGRTEKRITGRVTDCQDNKPIPGVLVSARQRGWGVGSTGIVWDKEYITTAKSAADGSFALSWSVGRSAQLFGEKEGYFRAQWFAEPGADVGMRMRVGGMSWAEVTYDCKTTSECLSCNVENGVEVCKNVCFGE